MPTARKLHPRVHLDSILLQSNLAYKDAMKLKDFMENNFDKGSLKSIIEVFDKLNDVVYPTRKKKTVKKTNQAFMKLMTPSKELSVIVGSKPLARTTAVSKVWDYIKKHDLQDPKNKRNIICNDSLKAGLGGKHEKVTMFELAALIGKNLS